MQLRRSVRMTPDKTVSWSRKELPNGTLYLSEDASAEDAGRLTMEYPFQIGPMIGYGRSATVRSDGDRALKVAKPGQATDLNRWRKYWGFESVLLNVALQTGMERLGEDARLPSGARLTTPTYLGAMVFHRWDEVQVLMIFESGTEPEESKDAITIGTQASRRAVYDAALETVGRDPSSLAGYDDKRDNLLIRDDAQGNVEVVKLDACDRTVVEHDWALA
jgi:hypothetical protein